MEYYECKNPKHCSNGASPIIVDVECHITNSLPNIVIVGFANKAVGEAKERVRSAFSNSNSRSKRTDSEESFANSVVRGELGLDGSVTPIRGAVDSIADKLPFYKNMKSLTPVRSPVTIIRNRLVKAKESYQSTSLRA